MGIRMLTKEQIEANKGKFLSILDSVERDGISDLCRYLENETDFFTAPASTSGHCGFEGGLCVHSINVCSILKNLTEKKDEIPSGSAVICGLLHDLCKANFYEIYEKNVKKDGQWVREENYRVADQFPMGHGEKSVFIISRFIKLTDAEAVAIRWHMSGWDDAARGYSSGLAQSNAYEKYPLAAAMAIADMYATYFMDKKA